MLLRTHKAFSVPPEGEWVELWRHEKVNLPVFPPSCSVEITSLSGISIEVRSLALGGCSSTPFPPDAPLFPVRALDGESAIQGGGRALLMRGCVAWAQALTSLARFSPLAIEVNDNLP